MGGGWDSRCCHAGLLTGLLEIIAGGSQGSLESRIRWREED